MTNADIIERYRERVAIKIHCGGLSEVDAIRQAAGEVRELHGAIPDEIKLELKKAIEGELWSKKESSIKPKADGK